ncbi:MBL fold metallo-hydrolase [Bacteroidia bacterium]|nr:MBL fold metallo-hydrolase [Bacteroidia bacterium]
MRNYILLFIFLLCIAPFGRLGAQEPITYGIGDFQVSILPDGGFEGGLDLLAGASPEVFRKYLPDGTFPLQIQAFLVRTPGRTTLVDAGAGNNLHKNLESLGVDGKEIHVILLTHMHSDHIGGLLRDGKKAFPNAELYLSQAEADYWNGEKERGADARKVIDAYKGKVHFFVPGGLGKTPTELFPGIQAIAAYGHTPGHTVFLLKSNQSHLLLWGDVAHAMPIQMPRPEVALAFDTNQAQAIQTRKSLLEYVTKNKIRVAGAHIPFPAIGHITPGKEEGYQFTPLCTCEGF